MVRNDFRDKLTTMSGQTKAAIFTGLDDMIDLHTTVADELNQTNNDIGKVLMKNFARFAVYRDYCVNLEKCQTLLQNEEAR